MIYQVVGFVRRTEVDAEAIAIAIRVTSQLPANTCDISIGKEVIKPVRDIVTIFVCWVKGGEIVIPMVFILIPLINVIQARARGAGPHLVTTGR